MHDFTWHLPINFWFWFFCFTKMEKLLKCQLPIENKKIEKLKKVYLIFLLLFFSLSSFEWRKRTDGTEQSVRLLSKILKVWALKRKKNESHHHHHHRLRRRHFGGVKFKCVKKCLGEQRKQKQKNFFKLVKLVIALDLRCRRCVGLNSLVSHRERLSFWLISLVHKFEIGLVSSISSSTDQDSPRWVLGSGTPDKSEFCG